MAEAGRIRRILMTADTVGGVWTYALDLARGLNDHKVEVVLATMGAPLSSAQWKEAAAVPNITIRESTYKLEWMPDAWPNVDRAGDWLLELEAEVRPDIIHLNGYAHGGLAWRAPVLVVGHSCVLSWWKAVKGTALPAEWSQYQFAVTRGVQAADLVIAPTRAMLKELQQYYGPVHSTAVIANGRCSDAYYIAPKEAFILAAGRVWDEAKSIAMLGGIGQNIGWPIYVAGENRRPDGGSVNFENVNLLGVLDPSELASWYSRAAIYCLPARYEPFGLSVLEAALSGCALVLGDIPSLRENWEGAAVFVDPGNESELRWGLRGLIENPRRLTSLAAAALHRARKFTARRTVNSYLSAYSQVLHKPIPMAAAGN